MTRRVRHKKGLEKQAPPFFSGTGNQNLFGHWFSTLSLVQLSNQTRFTPCRIIGVKNSFYAGFIKLAGCGGDGFLRFIQLPSGDESFRLPDIGLNTGTHILIP
jgi:hypothetical protein